MSGDSTTGDDATTDGTTEQHPVTIGSEAGLDDLLASHATVLVELFTEGCSVCASEEPVLSGVARTTDALVVVCNPRDDPALIERFEVRSVPTFLLFRDGDLVARRADGFQSVDDLVELIDGATA